MFLFHSYYFVYIHFIYANNGFFFNISEFFYNKLVFITTKSVK